MAHIVQADEEECGNYLLVGLSSVKEKYPGFPGQRGSLGGPPEKDQPPPQKINVSIEKSVGGGAGLNTFFRVLQNKSCLDFFVQ